LRRVDSDAGEPRLGLLLTVLCGAASGCLATGITFPMDTIRRRMQIQNLHVEPADRLTSRQQLVNLVRHEGLSSLYRGWKPEFMKVVPMVGTMFVTYEWAKEMLDVKHNR
jgi:solute carrier family 25 phosphate transporter 23/24/25/41